MTNGTEKQSTIFSELAGLVADHGELVALELRYESAQAVKRGIAFAVASLFALAAFAIFEVVVLHGLVRVGLNWLWASMTLCLTNGLIAFSIFWFAGRRDPRVGGMFEGSRREMKETLEWIQKRFS